MSATDVANVAYNAGFRGDALVTAIAVSLAEDPASDPGAECHNCAGVTEWSIGYWQINILANPQYALLDLKNGQVNAHVAYEMSSGGANWAPWATYTGGQYQQYVSQAQTLAAGVSEVPASSNLPTLPTLNLPVVGQVTAGMLAIGGLAVLGLVVLSS